MDARAHLDALLNGILAGGLPGRVHVMREMGPLPGVPHGHPVEPPRLSICLRGEAVFWARKHGERHAVRLRPRDLIYVLPGRVIQAHPEASFETLGIVFHPGFTRFLHTVGRGGETRRARVYHAPGLLPKDGRFVCHSLEAEAPGDPRDRRLRLKLELLLHNAQEALRSTAVPAHGKAHLAWEAACQFIHDHCHESIGRDDVAAFVDVHPNHLSRLFAAFSDRPFNGYLCQVRLSRSQRLLRDPRLTVEQVARMSGFESGNYFIRQYRKRYGITPSRARSLVS